MFRLVWCLIFIEYRLRPSLLKVISNLELNVNLWEVKGQFMAGPFLNYQIKTNSKNNQQIMLDGFVYSPGTDKREYIFELEAIMRSLKY